jgi:hypothetical protein
MTPQPQRVEEGQDYTVNQDLPISLSWSPQGLASAYELQIATDPLFESLVVQEGYLVNARYAFDGAEPETVYSWRVRTFNDGGLSDWATGSFATVAPMIEVTAPNGGESFRRGATVYIHWQDNLNEEVAIDLLKGGAVVQTLDTVASSGAYVWDVSLMLETGEDYTIQIRSTVDDTKMDVSDAPFEIR